MSTIKVDTIATRTGSGNITLSNNVASLTSAGAISGTNLSASGTLAVTGNTTVGGTLVNTGLITASAGVAIGGTGAANTLDDYEEGIHNAVTTTTDDTSTALGITQEDALQYVKIGSMVFIHGSIAVGGASATGAIRVSLPFAPTSLSERADLSYFNVTLDAGDGGGGAAQVGQFIGEVNGAVGAEIRVYATDQLSFQSDSAQSMDISCGIGIMGFYYST